MGLFDKFSKKDKNSVDELAVKANKLISSDDDKEKNDVEKAVEKAKNEAVAAVEKKNQETKSEPKEQDEPKTGEKRRFTLLVEDAFQLKDDLGVVVGGGVHGTVNNHDKVYILHPILGDGIEAEVEGIEEGPTNMVETATDSRVGIRFTSIKDRNQIPKYSVVTNIRPQAAPTKENPDAESPFLYGLCHEYNRLIKEGAFQSIFTFALFSSRYITPVKIDVDLEQTTVEKAVLKSNKVSFKLLHHPNDESLHVLPVFTDFIELKKWKDAYEGNEQPQNFFMSFEQCAEIGLKNGGYVINPFGYSPVFVSNDNIKQVLQMKANLDKRIADEKKSEAEKK